MCHCGLLCIGVDVYWKFICMTLLHLKADNILIQFSLFLVNHLIIVIDKIFY